MNNIDIGRYKRIVQYFWDPEPKNEEGPGSRLWCLGSQYVTQDEDFLDLGAAAPPSETSQQQPSSETEKQQKQTNKTPDELSTETPSSDKQTPGKRPATTTSSSTTSSLGWPKAFLDDFESKIWMTYRSNFPTIAKSEDQNASQAMSLGVRLRSHLTEGFTSDTGWGCMIRSGQSLLANAIFVSQLGRDWRRGTREEDESRLLSMFADEPDAPFSIHRFVNHGSLYCGKHPGEWFGPSATSRCIEALCQEHSDAGLNVYVTNDSSDVYEDRFRAVALDNSGHMRPTLILLGIRLGIDRVTPVYRKSLEEALMMPQSIGIAGGRPSASHYFVGVQNPYYFYLDPHHTRPALPPREKGQKYTQEELDSYHTRRLRRLHIDDMDPSMLVGFLIKDEDDWTDWKRRIQTPQETGKAIVHVHAANSETAPSPTHERATALDEVEALDDSELEE
ncbi:autophagy-related protein 4 [Talaromyces islandicus]|uniref:Cysteine protease n=1 Tax=Talaromyces islandicus TaxID=28573 RepID=A0A0U1LJR4_TALIS|nr:autophagy-related protein 4 [Talaromyces islandicus]